MSLLVTAASRAPALSKKAEPWTSVTKPTGTAANARRDRTRSRPAEPARVSRSLGRAAEDALGLSPAVRAGAGLSGEGTVYRPAHVAPALAVGDDAEEPLGRARERRAASRPRASDYPRPAGGVGLL